MNKIIKCNVIFVAIVVFVTYQVNVYGKNVKSGQNSVVSHYLDPLTANEIKSVVEIIGRAGKTTSNTRFALIELNEPDKSNRKTRGSDAMRQAYVLMYDWTKKSAFEAIIELNNAKIMTWNKLSSSQPPNTYIIIERIEEIVFADQRWRKAMSKRGIESTTAISLWPDLLPFQKLNQAREDVVVSVVALNNNPSSARGRYLNLDIQVNLTAGTVVKITDNGFEADERKKNQTLIPKQSSPRNDSVFYKAGNDFVINGTRINWDNWQFHFSVNPRRGLEIYDVNYIENGKKRKILYRASLSEIVTPYGDPAWYSWYPVDEGDLNFANYALVPTADNDVLPNAVFKPAIVHNSAGQPKKISKSIAIYEKYGGLAWRHYQESRRAKDLVLSSHFMVDNYDYVLSWRFKENGSIIVEVTLTGMINYGIADSNRAEKINPKLPQKASHTRVAPGVYGPIHQHFFNFRLDFDIDGPNNTVAEVNVAMLPIQPDNLQQEWFAMTKSVLKSEKKAVRRINPYKSRSWQIYNENKKNMLGQNPSYYVIPKDNTFPAPGAGAGVRKKTGFINANFWVTPYSSTEMYAAGKYLGAGYSGEGLPKWVQADRNIENKDLVVWYTMGTTHMPRPEDWPVMPAKTISFEIKPFGFFTKNPALNK